MSFGILQKRISDPDRLLQEAAQKRSLKDVQGAMATYLFILRNHCARSYKIRAHLELGITCYEMHPPQIKCGIRHLKDALGLAPEESVSAWIRFYLGEFLDMQADSILAKHGKTLWWRWKSRLARRQQKLVLHLDSKFKYRAHVLKDLAWKLYVVEKNFKRSEELLLAALGSSPLDSERFDIEFSLAHVLGEQKEYRRAYDYAKRALDESNNELSTVKLLDLLGSIAAHLGLESEALTFFHEAYERTEGIENQKAKLENIGVLVALHLANQYYSVEKYAQSKAILLKLFGALKSKAQERLGYLFECYKLLGFVEYSLESFPTAADACIHALEIRENDPIVLALGGSSLFHCGRYIEATRLLKSAMKYGPFLDRKTLDQTTETLLACQRQLSRGSTL